MHLSISSGARGQPNLIEVSTKHIFSCSTPATVADFLYVHVSLPSRALSPFLPPSLHRPLNSVFTGCTTTCYHLLYITGCTFFTPFVVWLCFTVLYIVAYLFTVLAYSVLLCTRLLIHCTRLLCITVYLHNTFTDLRRGCLLSNIFFTLRVRKKYSTVQYSGINNRVPGNELRGKGGGGPKLPKSLF